MLDLLAGTAIAAIIFVTGFTMGNEVGRREVHRGDVVCVTSIDGSPYCVPKRKVKP